MTQEEKDLVLRDLSGRLPYGVKCQFEDNLRITDGESSPFYDYALSAHHLGLFMRHSNFHIKPYLRPMSSMTEEEKKEYTLLANRTMVSSVGFIHFEANELIDWLNKKMFDFQGLIPKGRAIEVNEENNPYEN